MKRRLFRVGLLLMLGAIINVAVAWALVNLSAEGSSQKLSSAESITRARQIAGPSWPSECDDGDVQRTAWGVEWLYVGGEDADDPMWVLFIARTGFPMHALAGGFFVDPQDLRAVNSLLVGEYDFPYAPLWFGFTVNTAVYAAVVWLLLFSAGRFRRRRRIKRGLCPCCAYDLQGTSHEACPECGQSISFRSR